LVSAEYRSCAVRRCAVGRYDARVLQVRGYIYDVVAAGGHQLYGCVGTSLSQARPLHVGLYGLPHEQSRFTPVSLSPLSSQATTVSECRLIKLLAYNIRKQFHLHSGRAVASSTAGGQLQPLYDVHTTDKMIFKIIF